MKNYLPRSTSGIFYTGVVLVFALIPVFVSLSGQIFYLDIFSRIMVLGIAAMSLNLLIGYGGMISLGHAAFLGIGAYCVGIPVYYEIYNGWVHLVLAIVVCGIFALVTGAISLRTKGVYFIMITLAFAQMVYFTFVSLEEYGGDDGLVIELRSEFGTWLDLEDNMVLYYTIFGVLLVSLFVVNRLVQARFGRVILGSKYNERRMQSLGFDTYRYRLVCYVISGILCGIAGLFLGNFTSFISPEMMDWTRSGELIFMVILGGTGVLFGPIIGAGVFILLEVWLPQIITFINKLELGVELPHELWHLILGAILIAVVLFGRGGIHGLLTRRKRG
ncbi:MAG: branched-chain amino acid ABC transporter permease [Arenicellales bacterium]|nr:branched-chain amino acid ABC transporter permease [Arenicellales bacterium]